MPTSKSIRNTSENGSVDPSSHMKQVTLLKIKSLIFLLASAFFLLGFVEKTMAQDAFIESKSGVTTLCQGQSTTLQVVIGASVGPYTVVYSDGVTPHTLNTYHSIGDPADLAYGGDAITVTPSATTSYTLVSVKDFYGTFLPIDATPVTITVNPLPSSLVVSQNPTGRVCPGVNFTISAFATNGSTYELWNQANTTKIGNLPYVTSVAAATTYTVRAISSALCSITQSFTVNMDNVPPTITCPGAQTINTGAGNCSAALPDYTGMVTVSDNCTANGSILKVQSPVAGTILTGHNTVQSVTIMATDASGNSSNCSFNVTVKDVTIPGITCIGNQIVNPDTGTCVHTHSGTAWNAVATDNCTVASVTYTLTGATTGTGTSLNGKVFQPGTTTVTWTATDVAGNTNTCSYTVSIVDNQNPVATCPGNQTVNTASGICTYTKSGTDWNVTASDNCTVASISYALTGATIATVPSTLNGVVFNKGVTNIVCTVSDGAAIPNTANCSFSVTVNDNQDPTLTCPSNISVNNTIDAGNTAVTVPDLTFGDNCGGSVLAWSTSGATTLSGTGQIGLQTFNVGVTTLTCTVTDASSRTAQCTFTVTVHDTQNPTITCPANISVNNDLNACTASVVVPVVLFGDNCSGASISWITSGATSGSGNGQMGTHSFNTGVTTVSYTVTDASLNTAQCSFTVTITDSELPTIGCPSNITTNNDLNACNATVVVPAITYSDNCPGSILTWSTTGATIASGSGQIGTRTFNLGITTVNYTVSDLASPANTANCSFTVTVIDNQKPVISGCPSNKTVSSSPGGCNAVVSWTEPTATDNCTPSGSLVWSKSHLPGSTFAPGTTVVTYTATDQAGNTSVACSFTITVNDLQKPVITGCPSNITVSNTTGLCTGIATWTEPSATDNCTATGSLTWNRSHLPGAAFPVGNTVVTYTATDANGNTSNPCSFTVTVLENEAPVAICKNKTLVLDGTGNATLLASDVNNGSTDNCTASGSLILSLSKSSFTCANKGPNTVVMTVRDAAGNSSTCSSTVTVVDNTAPVIHATGGTIDATVGVSTGGCTYTISGSEFDPTVTDNCTGSVLNYTVSGATTLSGTGTLAGKILNKGANAISWNATDASGNTTAVPFSFTKTVTDNLAPVISAKTNQLRGTNSGCAYVASAGEFDVSITDNCGVLASQTYKINSALAVPSTTLNGVSFPIGTNTVTWTASDGNNTSTRTFQVTVSDNVFPTISQISNKSVNINSGCGAVVTWAEPTYNDNCTLTTSGQILGPPSGSTFPVGITTIRYKATDGAGHVTQMSFTVTVADQTPPVLTCPVGAGGEGSSALNPYILEAGTGVCFHTITGTEYDATVTDGCPLNLVLSNSFDGTNTLKDKQIPVGMNAIVWTAYDGTNTSTCTSYIKITDTQFPTFNQPTGNFPRSTDPKQCYFTVPGTEFDLSNIVDNCATIPPPAYEIKKNGVTVLTGLNSLASLKLPKDAAHPYSVVWTLTDNYGNQVVSTPFTISVTDAEAPTFDCHGNMQRVVPSDACSYTVNSTEFDPTGLSDNCDAAGSLIISFTLDGNPGIGQTLAGQTFMSGVHPIVWTITDLSGNTAVCTFNVTVTDPVAPSISAITDQTRTAPSNQCYYQAVGAEFNPVSVTDNCSGVTLVNNQNNTSTLAGFHFPVGITVVVWKATDTSGNITPMQYQVTVEDNTPPDFSIFPTVGKNASASSCYYTVSGTEFDPFAITDNCTSANYTILNDYNHTLSLASEQFPVGTTNVEWSVKDNYGNEQKKTMVITVTDATSPVISCPGSSYTRGIDYGQTYYTVGTDEFKPVATDNCTLSSYTNDYNSLSSLNGIHLSAGTYHFVWTALDASGHSSTCQVDLDVLADLYPTINCVGDQSRNNTNNVCGYTVVGSEFNPTSPGAVLTNDFSHTSTLAGSTLPVGNTLVTWTATKTINGSVYTNHCSYYVFVTDNQKPSITAPADVNQYTTDCSISIGSIGTPVTSDNCGISKVWNNAGTLGIGSHTVTCMQKTPMAMSIQQPNPCPSLIMEYRISAVPDRSAGRRIMVRLTIQ